MKVFIFDSRAGFSLIEVGFILVILGLLLFIGSGAWQILIEGRRISAVNNIISSSNNCLIDYVLIAKRLPTNEYFKRECSKIDPWGNELNYSVVIASENGLFNCHDKNLFTAELINSDGSVSKGVVWVVYSYGPNRKQDMKAGSNLYNFEKGDDLYGFVTDMELKQQACP